MPDLPVMLRISGKKAVIVGGGSVALRRAAALTACGADVTVIAPHVDEEIQKLAVHIDRRPYHDGDLEGARLVVIATDDPQVNEAAHREADRVGALVNRTDAPDRGDLAVMAHDRRGAVTVAVATDGISAKAAATIRDELLVELDQDWVRLLEAVAPFRGLLQERVKDLGRRRAALMKLADVESVALLKESGVEALRARCQAIVREATTP